MWAPESSSSGFGGGKIICSSNWNFKQQKVSLVLLGNILVVVPSHQASLSCTNSLTWQPRAPVSQRPDKHFCRHDSAPQTVPHTSSDAFLMPFNDSNRLNSRKLQMYVTYRKYSIISANKTQEEGDVR